MCQVGSTFCMLHNIAITSRNQFLSINNINNSKSTGSRNNTESQFELSKSK